MVWKQVDDIGKETVQCYIQDLFASMARPMCELKAFEKIELAPGESRRLTFRLGFEALAFSNGEKKWDVEPGAFDVYVGSDSCTSLSIKIDVNA